MNSLYEFPTPTGLMCHMMPIIQGDSTSLPKKFDPYKDFVENFALEAGEVGWLTIQESDVFAGTSQRGFGKGARTLHREVGLSQEELTWGAPTWGDSKVTLCPHTRVLIANSIDDTCMVWPTECRKPSLDGDLAPYLNEYPRERGAYQKAGEVLELGLFTPHECIPQPTTSPRQFVRLVGQEVHGAAPYFTKNPLLAL